MQIFPSDFWEKASPESQGLDEDKFRKVMNDFHIRSGGVGADETVVVRNGYLIWQGSAADHVHEVFSATKTFTSTVLGLLSTDNVLNVDDLAVKYMPSLCDLYPEYGQITLGHLASMMSGYDSVMGSGWEHYHTDRERHREHVLTYTEPGVPLFEAGKMQQYHDPQVHLLGYILTQVSGQSLSEMIWERIAKPIGMQAFSWSDYGVRDGMFFNNPAGTPGINQQGEPQGGVYSNALDLARYGLLYLNQGNWQGKQILDPVFVARASHNQVPVAFESRFAGRYGFYWWTNGVMGNGERPIPSAPAHTYMAHGAGRNFIVVVPEWHMVIVRLSTAPGGDIRVGGMKEVVWDAFFSHMEKAILEC